MKKDFQIKRGFSLVEVMVAMTVLAITGMAVMGTTMITRKAAESNIYEITAHTVASGYMEQINAMTYDELIDIINNPTTPLPTMINQGTDDPLYIDTYNDKVIPLNTDVDGNVNQVLTVSVKPILKSMVASNNYEIINITIVYKWDAGVAGGEQEWAIRCAKTNI